MEHNSTQRVSSEQVQQLYREFRKAALTSTARELQKQQQVHLQQQVEILNVPIDNLSINEFLGGLKRGVVFTPNVDHLMKLQKDTEFVEAYSQADYRVCDSQVLMMASKFLGTPIKAKISGSDLFPSFCEHHKDNENIKIFMLGGAEGVAAKARRNINARIGREIIVAAHSPSFGFEKSEEECQAILEMIRQSSANVLVVGVGAPKQEKWIAKYRDQLPNIDIFMAVGASIDFEAGNKPRAPQLMSDLGLEWLYRLSTEPQRLWKRYLVDDLPFFWLLLKEKMQRLRRRIA
ncbi:MAG TPA: WecB/TagA/CpsF family glycosyltransferase [Leptolyngbyaceae cyanobacterium]